MPKNTTGTAPASAAERPAVPKTEKPAAPKGEQKPDGCAAGFYCYIGPSLTGLIQNGAIFKGNRKEALKAAAAAIERQPLVKTLIVSGDQLPEARLKVKRPGNALYANYAKIAASKQNQEVTRHA